MQPLIDGTVKARDLELDIHVNSDDRIRQHDARAGKFDIAEFFNGIYIADLEQQTLGVTAIPIFVKRMFGILTFTLISARRSYPDLQMGLRRRLLGRVEF